MAASISVVEELDVMCRTSSFCCASRVASSDDEMVGCEGRESSMTDADFEAATDEGRVSGSKSAFNILLSFEERAVVGIETAILNGDVP